MDPRHSYVVEWPEKYGRGSYGEPFDSLAEALDSLVDEVSAGGKFLTVVELLSPGCRDVTDEVDRLLDERLHGIREARAHDAGTRQMTFLR